MVDMRLSEEEIKLEETAARSSNILLVALEKGTEGTSIDKISLRIRWWRRVDSRAMVWIWGLLSIELITWTVRSTFFIVSSSVADGFTEGIPNSSQPSSNLIPSSVLPSGFSAFSNASRISFKLSFKVSWLRFQTFLTATRLFPENPDILRAFSIKSCSAPVLVRYSATASLLWEEFSEWMEIKVCMRCWSASVTSLAIT